jgi:hypothetical protein
MKKKIKPKINKADKETIYIEWLKNKLLNETQHFTKPFPLTTPQLDLTIKYLLKVHPDLDQIDNLKYAFNMATIYFQRNNL